MIRRENGISLDIDEAKVTTHSLDIIPPESYLDVNARMVQLVKEKRSLRDYVERSDGHGVISQYFDPDRAESQFTRVADVQQRFAQLVFESCDIAAEAERYLDEGWC